MQTVASAPAARTPRVHTGSCPDHGGFLLFWCETHHVWLCRDCTVVDHTRDQCTVLSLKQAIDSLQGQQQKDTKQLTLRLAHLESLRTSLKSFKTIVQGLMEAQESLDDGLQGETEAINALLEKGVEKRTQLDQAMEKLAKETNEEDTSNEILSGWDSDHREVKEQKAVCHLRSSFTIMKITELKCAVKLVRQSDIMSAPIKDFLHGPKKQITKENASVETLREVLAQDPDMLSRGIILELKTGTFNQQHMCTILGDVESIDSLYNNFYIVTFKNAQRRDCIAAKIKKITNNQNSTSYFVHSVGPTPARVEGDLEGIPSFYSKGNMDDILATLDTSELPLNDITLKPGTWQGTTIHNGTIHVKAVTTDLWEFSRAVKEGIMVDVPLGYFTGKLKWSKVIPLEDKAIQLTGYYQVNGWTF